MIHYHGLPITPLTQLYKMAGKHLCASFATAGRQADIAMTIGQSVLWDNGAFSFYTQGQNIDEAKLYAWLEARVGHPHRAIVLDRIGGTLETQREMVSRWPFPRDLSWPVWHLDKPLDYLSELADEWPGVCLGSSGEYWQIGTAKWEHRMDEAFNLLGRRRFLPWIHGLRMLGRAGDRWPLASADSVNVARNWNSGGFDPRQRADEIDSVQPPLRWTPRALQTELVA